MFLNYKEEKHLLRCRIVTIPIKQNTADVFDSVLETPLKLISGTRKENIQLELFSTLPKNPISNSTEQIIILNPQKLEEKIRWSVPITISSKGAYSELVCTLFKPEKLTDQQFIVKTRKAELILNKMIQIIENQFS